MSHLTRRTVAAALFTTLAVAIAAPAMAQSRTGGSPNSMYAGIGLKGYDPVSYFEDGKAAKGDPAINAFDGTLTWHFTSEAHKAAFEADPAHFQPQNGGYCTWGVAKGKLFDVDPEAGWTIVNDKLYVNFNADINAAFAADAATFIAQADANWPTLNQ